MITDRYNKTLFQIESADYKTIEAMLGRHVDYIRDVRGVRYESAKIANDWIKINFRKGE